MHVCAADGARFVDDVAFSDHEFQLSPAPDASPAAGDVTPLHTPSHSARSRPSSVVRHPTGGSDDGTPTSSPVEWFPKPIQSWLQAGQRPAFGHSLQTTAMHTRGFEAAGLQASPTVWQGSAGGGTAARTDSHGGLGAAASSDGFVGRPFISRLTRHDVQMTTAAAGFDFRAHFGAPMLRDGSTPSAAPRVVAYEQLQLTRFRLLSKSTVTGSP